MSRKKPKMDVEILKLTVKIFEMRSIFTPKLEIVLDYK